MAKVLKANGIPPAPGRPSSWRTFLRAHWGGIAGADFFTTEVWTPRGLLTYYTLFVLDLKSRRVEIVGSTRNPDAAFMGQAARRLTDAVDGFLARHRVLICDRDRKWTDGFKALLEGAGVRIVRTPVQAPNANAYAERFVRSIREECLERLILFGEQRLLHVLKEFVVHYHEERNHQGIGNDLLAPGPRAVGRAGIRCRRAAGSSPRPGNAWPMRAQRSRRPPGHRRRSWHIRYGKSSRISAGTCFGAWRSRCRRRSAAMTGCAAHREEELDISCRSQSACHCLDDHCPPGLNTPRTAAIVRATTS